RSVSSALRASHTGSGTIILPVAGISVPAICSGVALCSPVSLNSTTLPACLRTASSTTGRLITVHSSGIIALFRMRLDIHDLFLFRFAVNMPLEWRDADTAHGINKSFFGRAFPDVNLDQA